MLQDTTNFIIFYFHSLDKASHIYNLDDFNLFNFFLINFNRLFYDLIKFFTC